VEFFFEVGNGGDYLGSENLTRSHAHEIADIVWVSQSDDIAILPKGLAEDFKAGKMISEEVRYLKD